jgi:hypothetical protein
LLRSPIFWPLSFCSNVSPLCILRNFILKRLEVVAQVTI